MMGTVDAWFGLVTSALEMNGNLNCSILELLAHQFNPLHLHCPSRSDHGSEYPS